MSHVCLLFECYTFLMFWHLFGTSGGVSSILSSTLNVLFVDARRDLLLVAHVFFGGE